MSLSGNTAKINELITKINALPEEPTPSYQEKTVTPSTSAQTVTPDSGYDALSQVTVNAMPTATQATPSIEVSAGGLITAKATQTAGYVAAGTKSATKQLTVQAAQTITPGTSNKTIASGRYLTGTQTIKGDANLLPANIKSGVSIFGVAGTLEEGSGGSGGGVETCEVEFLVSNSGASGTRYVLCQQVSEDGTTETTNVALSYGKWQGTTTTFTAKKGGLVLYHNNGSALNSNNASSVKNCEQVFGSLYFIAFEIGQKETAKIVVFT